MEQIIELKNVQEAVNLARTFKEQGKYVFFRGQFNSTWNVVSSLARWQHLEKDEDNYNRRIMRFYEFCKKTAELAYLCEKEHVDELVAIMQHYGIPTHYIDFTRDPSIAAFFASDGENAVSGQYSSIVCLEQKDIDIIDQISREVNIVGNLQSPENSLLEIEVTHLWRLQAQQGIFLFMPFSNFEESYSYALDRIVFPTAGIVQSPLRNEIYPSRKSPLESLLDHYFDNEQKLINNKRIKEWFSELQKKHPATTSYMEAKDNLSSMKDYLKKEAKPCQSWMDANIKIWQQS